MPDGLIGDQSPGPGYWKATDGRWYPPPAPFSEAPPTASVSHGPGVCPNGHQIAESSKFCTGCGLPRAAVVPQPPISYCTKCEAPAKPGVSFCAICGAAIAPSQAATQQHFDGAATSVMGTAATTGEAPVVRTAQPARSHGPWLVVAIIAAVLVLGLAGGLAFALAGKGSSPKAAAPPPQPTHATTTSTTTTTPSTSTTTVSPGQQVAVQALSVLLTQSVIDRSAVNTASDDATACGPNLSADSQTFETAYNSRQSLLEQLPGIQDLSDLPPALTQALTGAWKASGQVDQDYAEWANDEYQYGCASTGTSDPYYVDAKTPNDQATFYKQTFCNLWNPIAKIYGYSPYQWNQL